MTVYVAASGSPAADQRFAGGPTSAAQANYVCSGTADQTLINTALAAGAGEVVLLPGTYNLTGSIVLPDVNLALRGAGKATVLAMGAAMTAAAVVVNGPSLSASWGVHQPMVENLSIDGSATSGANTGAHGLEIAGAVLNGTFRRLWVTNCKGHSVYVHASCISPTVTITGTPTGGTFTLTWNGQTTAAIAYNATASAVQSALQALSGIGTAVTCSGGPLPGTSVVATFTGALAVPSCPIMTATSSLTGGSSPAVNILVGERPAYNLFDHCTLQSGNRDGMRLGDDSPTGFYAERNDVRNCVITLHTTSGTHGLYATGNNNRITDGQFDYLDTGLMIAAGAQNTVCGCTFDRSITNAIALSGQGNHTVQACMFSDHVLANGTVVNPGTGRAVSQVSACSGNAFLGNHFLLTSPAPWAFAFGEDAGCGSTSNFGPSKYLGNSGGLMTANQFSGTAPITVSANAWRSGTTW